MTPEQVAAFLNDPANKDALHVNFERRTGRHVTIIPLSISRIMFVPECDGILIMTQEHKHENQD